MDTLVETYKIGSEETENLNILITSNKIESIIKIFPTNRSPRSNVFVTQFY